MSLPPAVKFGANTLTGGAANTKGAWGEITASSPEAVGVLRLILFGSTDNIEDILIDVGTGAVSAEVVQVANLLYTTVGTNTSQHVAIYDLVVNIPAGTRIAMRCQSSTASGAVVAHVYGLANTPTSAVTTFGANTADSGGTTVDPGGTINTKGAWVEFIASTAAAVDWVVLAVGTQINATSTTAKWGIDLGTGAGGAEVVHLADLEVRIRSAITNTPSPTAYAFPVAIGAGVRVAIRCLSNINDATDRLIDVVLYTMTENPFAQTAGGAIIHPGMTGGIRG